ncbi:nucleoside deaminase [Desulfovibrio sp. OttesenSCG-928-C14]|nr:nucleoside deaminase [Desulfovibrio sp. OttesenSCG-928-C14]
MARVEVPEQRIIPDPPAGWASWAELMALALEEARLNLGDAGGEPGEVPVGALVLGRDGRILGRGRNSPIRDSSPVAHAEVNALMEAGRALGNYRLYGAVLVVTLEPCLMCAAAAAHARLAGVVYGAADEAAGALHSRLNALDLDFLNHRPWTLGGILEDECSALLRAFFAGKRGA